MIRRKLNSILARKHGAAEPQKSNASAAVDVDPLPDLEDGREQKNCGCINLPLLAEVCETENDILIIRVLRFVLAGYSHDRAQCLDTAVDAAAAMHGEQVGLTLMARAMAVVRALKAERNGNFQYLPANCSHISEDEQELVAAMMAIRSEDPVVVTDAVTSLSRSQHAPRIMQAAWAFSMTAHSLPQMTTENPLLDTPRSTLH